MFNKHEGMRISVAGFKKKKQNRPLPLFTHLTLSGKKEKMWLSIWLKSTENNFSKIDLY